MPMTTRAAALLEAAGGTEGERHRLRRQGLALARELERDEGPEAALDFLRALFARGVFDRPPLSGEAYTAWRRLDAAVPPPPVPERGPRLSVIMPVYNPRPEHLRAALDSVRAQTWNDWELCIADDASTREDTRPLLEEYARRDARVRLVFRPENGHICAASNSALALASGAWCALLDQDDLLPPGALAAVAAAATAHPDAHVLFSDEDQFVETDGRRDHVHPFFKPGFDPDLLLSCNCVNHLGVYRADTLRALKGFLPGREGAQDYDLVLRVLARHGAGAFVHIPRVLYHWRRHEDSTAAGWAAKPYARDSARRARAAFAAATGLHAAFPVPETSTHARTRFLPPRRPPLLTIALLAGNTAPDAAFLTRWPRLLEGGGLAHETLIVCPAGATEDALRPLAERLDARLVPVLSGPAASPTGANFSGMDPSGANFSGALLANAALQAARGGVLCFQRLDAAPLTPRWAALACGALLRHGVGAVGGRSLSPRGFFHHAGYAVGYRHDALDAPRAAGDAAPLLCPAYAGLHRQSGGYFNWAHLPHAAPAARLDGLCCRRDTLEALGGFDARAGIWADADVCFRAWARRGLRSVILPLDILSAAPAPPPVDALAAPLLRERWGDLLAAPPFQPPALAWTPGGWRLRPPCFTPPSPHPPAERGRAECPSLKGEVSDHNGMCDKGERP